MVETRGIFIAEVPEMRIENGLVHIISEGENFYMRPSTVRRYVSTAEQLLDQWEADQQASIKPIRVIGEPI